MVGIFVQLVISWLLLWWLGKKGLSVLGFTPTRIRVLDLFFGLITASVCFAAYSLATTMLTGSDWIINDSFTITQFLKSFWWSLKSVLFEELIFRGALLYLLMHRIGVVKSCLASAVAFGIYHWFSFGIFGSPVQMVYVLFSTGLWGFMYAFAFAETKSLYLPIGLHLGWNLTSIVVFSQGPLGQQMLINANNSVVLTGLPFVIIFLWQLFALPVIVYFYLIWMKTRVQTPT